METKTDMYGHAIYGIDPSLSGTGISFNQVGLGYTRTVSSLEKGVKRVVDLSDNIVGLVAKNQPFIVVIEGLALQSRTGHALERAGLWYLTVAKLLEYGHPVYQVAPNSLKKFVTGKGNSEKSLMMREVYRKWDYIAENDNEADAFGLMRIGMCIAGIDEPRNESQRDVLKKVSEVK